jgi:alpha-L-fucosidase
MMQFRKEIVMFCGIALLTTFSLAQEQQLSPREKGKAWLKQAKFGVFVHYLGGGPAWNDKVESFDVEKFAIQLHQTGASYLIFTLGQNSGYYCSPNATYEKYAGYKTGRRCSRRDLPMEIAEALAEKGIRLMLYLPSRSPQRDKQAMAGLHDVHERQPAPQEFTKRWSEVIAEWSQRYGKKISGWWFDGSYNTTGWDDLTKRYNWNTWAAASRVGNPESILAFNPGTRIDKAFTALTDQQDYTAGEQNKFQVTPQTNPAPKELQWHILSFLGTHWAAKDGPTHSDQYMIDYVRKVNALGGTVSIDVNVSSDGKIYPPHLRQLIAIGKAVNR